ncbi:MAG: TIGR01620 family protein [Hyphomicrobium sp.]|jgi:putative membrane protein
MSADREPRVFSVDDPVIVTRTEPDAPEEAVPGEDGSAPSLAAARRDGLTASGILVSAMAGLIGLAFSVSFARFVSQALNRNDWVGWTATSLLIIAGVAALVLMLREIGGLLRLARITRLRRDAEKALKTSDRNLERTAVQSLRATFKDRPELAWGLARLKEHERDVRDPGDLFRLADREVLAAIDLQARRTILRSAKNVSVVTAMSPMVWLAMLYVMVENVRMLRSLAGLYGGRPGGLGALRLARMVVGHIIATGGLAMTDDLLGQFLGQDVLRRLSRRLGEGAFNGALTARIGAAAIQVTRPLPFLEAEPVRVRDLLPDVLQPVVGKLKQLVTRKT